MVSYADRLTSHDVQHGTLDGYASGCRAELSCPGRHAVGLSCLRAGIRYAGDWPFRRLVDAGVPEAEAAAQVDAATVADRARPARRRRARRRTTRYWGDWPTTGGQAVSGPPAASERGAA